MKKNLLLLLCFLLSTIASAQYYIPRNNVWAFGGGAGLDFSSGTPVSFTSSINTYEGCASVCNATGNLRFYTDGRTVYNRLGTIMPGGTAIVPFSTSSTMQGALIVPFVNDSSKYYIFSLEQFGTTPGRVAYSVVDMTLDGGLGDLVAGSVGIVIDTAMSEKMIAIPGNTCNIWLMTHRRDSAIFYARSITSSGISSTPVISNVGTFVGMYCYEGGVIKCSPDRQKIAAAAYHVGPMWGIEYYDFDATTGIVSNCRVLELTPTAGAFYGVEFSPDNTKLYATNGATYQWDISLPTVPAIVASRTTVCSTSTGGDLKTGPDGKIYVSKFGSFLDCISFPNVAGTGCGYISNAVNVSPNSIRWGLPNLVWNPHSIMAPSAICVGAATTLTASFGGGTWSSSDLSVATISTTGVLTGVAPGTVTISYSAGSTCDGMATITVVAGPTLTSASLCVGSAAALMASPGGGTWTSGTSGIATVGSGTGIATGVSIGSAVITYNGPGCPAATTVVTVISTLSITGGGTLCLGNTLTVSSTTTGGSWSSSSSSTASVGSASGVVTGVSSGTAMITYSAGGCNNTTVVTVTALPVLSGAGGALCAGSTITLSSTTSGGTWSSGSSSTATIGSSSGVVTGIAAGTAVITYSAGGCVNTAVVTVNPGVPPTGSSLCAGASITLTGSVPGGTWTSSNLAVATVGISSGVVNGIASGTAIITYLNPSGCPEITNVTVNALPGPIGGKLSLCETFSTMLNCSPGGGTWSSSSSNATISSTGLATGVTSGTATITYILPGGCYSTAIMSVNPLPAVIAGPTTVVQGATITLTNATPGGSWSSGDTTKVSVNSGGVVTGVAPGTATVYYTLPTGCKASVVITVTSKNTVAVSSNIITKPTLYPNPATNEITIKVDEAIFTSLSIYNAVGQEVITRDIPDQEMKVNIKLLPPGEYQVVFKGEGSKEILRFTKW